MRKEDFVYFQLSFHAPLPVMPRISVSLIALLWLNSLVAQTLLFRAHHPVSFLAFAYWTAIYVAIGVGLVRRARLAYWMGLILSVLQLVPALAWSFGILRGPVSSTLPGWYPVSLWVAFGLGLGLLLSLSTNRLPHPSRAASPTNA